MNDILQVHIDAVGYERNNLSVINNIHFTVAEGEFVGLIGPNGAGKSTTIKTILGINKFHESSIAFKQNARYAYVPEQPSFYDELTLWEHLDIIAALFGIKDDEFEKKAMDLIHMFSLEKAVHGFPKEFSKGMQQKLMLIQAFLIEPDLYIIDEPFIGLDPISYRMLLEKLREEQKRGAGILMCTHVLDTAEKVCDRFLFLSKGTMIVEGTLAELNEKAGLKDASLMDCFYHTVKGNTN
ncbi:ABC transporter ATP-binding protein [Bacillus gobiensis]|uniref:ABC transporter ATP-binding protein n=1 Tax=Bacillus gobiensis TaxID=1441095 RepID=UPI003D20B502